MSFPDFFLAKLPIFAGYLACNLALAISTDDLQAEAIYWLAALLFVIFILLLLL